jgi:enoyl-CoA hydratase/carnithine racemase
MPKIERDGELAVLNLGDDENRFSLEWLASIHQCLDEVEAMPSPVALVTVAEGKFFSNGLDLDWLTANLDKFEGYVETVQRLFSRVMTMGVPTIAAIQGHCYAAGAMLAMAHDWRVMRADRGFFCFPEIDINIPFSTGMDALLRAKLPSRVAIDAMTTGRRYGGEEALTAGLVDAAVAEDQVWPTASAMARPLAGKAGPTLATIKGRMFAEAAAALAIVEGLAVGQ